MEYQKKLKKSDVEDESMELDFDEEKYNREKEQRRQERMKKYEGCVNVILEQLVIHKEMTLETLNISCKEEERERLLPTAEIFREVIIEFLTAGTIDIGTIQKEQTDYLMDASEGFVLNEDVYKRQTQGLASYIIKQGGADKGVAIAFDSRHMSPEFAMEAAMTLAANGIKAVSYTHLDVYKRQILHCIRSKP